MWPSAVVLSRWLALNPAIVCNRRCLELGAGCGLVGLVAARLQKRHDKNYPSSGLELVGRQTLPSPCVILTDFNKMVLDNLRINVALNDLSDRCQVLGLDFYEQTGKSEASWIDMGGVFHEQVDVVLAADMICQPDDAYASANTIRDCLRHGGRAYVVSADALHRFGVDHFETACSHVGLDVVRIEEVDQMYGGKLRLLSGGIRQTSGYVEGMKLKIFTIEKS